VSIPYAILVAVGPDLQELDRVADLIDSVRAFESSPCHFVMVDDSEPERKLESHFSFPKNWTPISVRHPRRRFPKLAAAARRGKGICAAILEGLCTIAREAPEARFTLKMDTDALVIAPFVEKLNQIVTENPDVGMIGAYDRTPSGSLRDISKNAATVKSLHRPDSLIQRAKNRWGQSPRAVISRHIGDALKNGYTFGEHCLGGAYAVSGTMIARLLAGGYDDPCAWLPIDCPEDVMVGIYTKATGCEFKSFVAENEAFGVRHRGLDDSPQRLLERGYSVIHAVKNDAKFGEEEIREFFKARRER
jgi:hypothetical protein